MVSNYLVELKTKTCYANIQDNGIEIKNMEKGNVLILMDHNIKVTLDMRSLTVTDNSNGFP